MAEWGVGLLLHCAALVDGIFPRFQRPRSHVHSQWQTHEKATHDCHAPEQVPLHKSGFVAPHLYQRMFDCFSVLVLVKILESSTSLKDPTERHGNTCVSIFTFPIRRFLSDLATQNLICLGTTHSKLVSCPDPFWA